MTQEYDPYENAVAERVNGILKEEFVCNEIFENYQNLNIFLIFNFLFQQF